MMCFQFICSTSLTMVISCALPLIVPKLKTFVALERVRDKDLQEPQDIRLSALWEKLNLRTMVFVSLWIPPRMTRIRLASITYWFDNSATISFSFTPAKSGHLIIPLDELRLP